MVWVMASPDYNDEAVYAPQAVSRLTGLTAHCLRAWERRYGAIRPARTPGGARRYSERDVRRLRLLRRAVDAGHPISQVAPLDDAALTQRLTALDTPEAPTPGPGDRAISDVMAAARELDVARLDRVLALHLATLGTTDFVSRVAVPLLHHIGEEWAAGRLTPAEEHATSAALRTLLGNTLRRDQREATGPCIVFSTPAGERHELGSLMAAAYAGGLGAHAVFIGADLPSDDLARSALRLSADVIALGVAGVEPERVREEVENLRAALPHDVRILAGGCGAQQLHDVPGVEILSRLEELADHVRRIH